MTARPGFGDPSPSPFPWPDGRRMAVSLTFDVDGFTAAYTRDPVRAHERLGRWSEFAYGPTVGLPKILRLLEEYEVRATFFVPGYVAELCPEGVAAIVAGGHEIAHHAYMHENPLGVAPDQDEEILVRGIEALRRVAGVRPVGYRAPAVETRPSTPALLRRHGFRYDASEGGDDYPYLIETADGPLVELPAANGDSQHFAYGQDPLRGTGLASPEAALDVFAREFDATYRRGALFVSVYHPMYTGRPSRLLWLERLIRHMRRLPRVWWATADEIARHCQSVADRLATVRPEVPAARYLRPEPSA